MPLFQYDTLCVKWTSVLCGQWTDFLKIWSRFTVLSIIPTAVGTYPRPSGHTGTCPRPSGHTHGMRGCATVIRVSEVTSEVQSEEGERLSDLDGGF